MASLHDRWVLGQQRRIQEKKRQASRDPDIITSWIDPETGEKKTGVAFVVLRVSASLEIPRSIVELPLTELENAFEALDRLQQRIRREQARRAGTTE